MRAPVLARSVLVLLTLARCAYADVVELKDGRRMEGTFKGASPAIVAIDVGGRTVTFPFDDVRAVYFGEAVAGKPVPEPARTVEPAAHGRDASAALAALQAVQASAAQNATYGDFASRVSESRAVVETFLQNPAAPDDGLKAVMNAGIRLYALGVEAWGVRLRKTGYETLAADPAADLCPALSEKIRGARDQGLLKPTPQSQGIGVAAGLPQILTCASERVDDATRMMREPGK
jgi:hypothetical protein